MSKNFVIDKFWVYLLSVFLIMLPPFSLGVDLLNTHTISKLLWLILFFLMLLQRKSNESFVMRLFILYFLLQSVGVFVSENPSSFLLRFEDLFFAGLLLFVSSFLLKNTKDVYKLVEVLSIGAVLATVIQFIIFVFGKHLGSFIGYAFPAAYASLLEMNLGRGRVYMESYSESFVAVLILGNVFKRGVGGLSAGIISIGSLISGFRTRFFMMILSWGGVFFSKILGEFKKVFRTIILIVLVLLVVNYVVVSVRGSSVVNRVLLTDYNEDISTIYGRFDRWGSAYTIGLSSPFFGVGMGNYYDNLPGMMRSGIRFNTQSIEEFNAARYYPHNVFFREFAESGMLGFGMLVYILFRFILIDFAGWKTDNEYLRGLVIGFWVLFSYALFNPSVSVVYLGLFWLFRFMIEIVLDKK